MSELAVKEQRSPALSEWLKKEDSWAIIIALGIILLATASFFSGGFGFLKTIAVSISGWAGLEKLAIGLTKQVTGLIYLYVFATLVFSSGAQVMGYNGKRFAIGFSILFLFSVAVTVLGSNQAVKDWQLETPILALLIGLLFGNTITLPEWFQPALRTEYYVKTGIILMGATLPFTIILAAGPAAILQALIVSFATFGIIYFAATRLFGLDPRFGACLGAGGSICGVSAAIAIGGACRAEKQHVSVAISLVIVWAVAMIFLLPAWAKLLGLAPGVAGAWIGTSEFADAAGFAAAQAIGDERAVTTFTLMKVVGRDMFVGVWAFLVAILSVTVWEKSKGTVEKVDKKEIWRRFPKFIIGFFVASLFTTFIISVLGSQGGAAYSKEVIGALKTLRGWAFTWTFLCIGFTTRFRELAAVGWKPLAAFTLGVLVNVPLGYWLSSSVFAGYWLGIK